MLMAHLLDCSDANKDFQPAEPRPSRRSWLSGPRYDLASKDNANLGQSQGQDSFLIESLRTKSRTWIARPWPKRRTWISSQGQGL